jgi:hypothetical protein
VGGRIAPVQTSVHYKFGDLEWDVWIEAGDKVRSTFAPVERVLKAGK